MEGNLKVKTENKELAETNNQLNDLLIQKDKTINELNDLLSQKDKTI